MFSVTIYPVYFRFLLCYNGIDERQKYGVIEDSNKKSRAIVFARHTLYMYSFLNFNTEKVIKKE